jgi:hypothetical protein
MLVQESDGVTIRKRGIPSAFSKERIIALFLVFIDRHFWREAFAEDFYMLAVLGYFKGGDIPILLY